MNGRMGHIRWIGVLLLMLVAFLGKAQIGSIEGRVTMEGMEKPVSHAQVGLVMTSHATQTNDKGYYRLDSIRPGTYKIKVFLYGMTTQGKKIKVNPGTQHLDFKVDTLSENLKTVDIAWQEDETFALTRMQSVDGMGIYAGKKNEVILPEAMTADKATEKSRQVFAKVGGVHVWESDGAGVQLDVGTRGLNPKRSAHFNTRQNGYDISADALGYPETYYAPPVEALERIEVVRGAASLQYGPQFGGMINFDFKDGPKDEKIQVTTRQTGGAFGLFNSFNSVGGTVGDLNYYGFYKFKRGNGFRPNGQFRMHNGYGAFNYQVTKDLKVGFEFTKMNSLAQQPGGLTDQMFEEDPYQSIRERNWFKIDWNMASLKIDYRIDDRLKLNVRNFGLLGGRDALGFLGRIDRADPEGKRTLLKDQYRNFGNETRLIYHYDLFGKQHNLLVGTRAYHGFTDRKQGHGSDGSGADFRFLSPDNPAHSDYDFPSNNFALFAENQFYLTDKLSVTPGIRAEHIHTASDGHYRNVVTDLAGNVIEDQRIPTERERTRKFLLAGMGVSYKAHRVVELYCNISQNYRPIGFNDMRIVNPNLRVDPELQDERGFTSDVGIRGNIGKVLNYDASMFYLSYQDKIGSVLKTDEETFRPYRYRTNVADARHYGFEAFAQAGLLKAFNVPSRHTSLSLYANFSMLDAHYINSDENGIEGNAVEYAPPINLKTGLEFSYKDFKLAYRYSYTAAHYSDATNAEQVPSAIHGIIPSYQVMDLSAEYQYKFLNLGVGINNLTDNAYFTRRATGYPGPGIIPSKPRSFYVTLSAEF